MVWPPDSPWSPWWRTNHETARAACKLAKITSSDTVYELGSGDGEFILTAADEFGAKKAVGIEIDPLRHWISKLRVMFHRDFNTITFIKQNFFDVDISSATVVFVYLVPRALARLLPKLKKELKPGTRIVSLRYEINGLKPIKEDSIYKLYLYKM